MANALIVIIPAAAPAPAFPAGATVVRWVDVATLLSALERDGASPCILVTDGLHADTEAAVAGAVRAREGTVIEVRSARWDGETASPVSAACRGVISGFGLRGLEVAVSLAIGDLVSAR